MDKGEKKERKNKEKNHHTLPYDFIRWM